MKTGYRRKLLSALMVCAMALTLCFPTVKPTYGLEADAADVTFEGVEATYFAVNSFDMLAGVKARTSEGNLTDIRVEEVVCSYPTGTGIAPVTPQILNDRYLRVQTSYPGAVYWITYSTVEYPNAKVKRPVVQLDSIPSFYPYMYATTDSSDTGTSVAVGGTITYTVNFNNSEDKDTFHFIASIPKNTSFVSAAPDCKPVGDKLTWDLEIAKGETITLTYTVKVEPDAAGTYIDGVVSYWQNYWGEEDTLESNYDGTPVRTEVEGEVPPATDQVTYHANGGENAPVDENQYEAGAPVTLLPPGNMTWAGHVFRGWANTDKASNPTYSAAEVEAGKVISMPERNLTLYAVWREESSINVSISWGDMQFTYRDSGWNPETHEYDDGEWAPASKNVSNRISVQNNGNVPVTPTYSFSSTGYDYSVTGRFVDGEENELIGNAELPINGSADVYLQLNGRVENPTSLNNTTVGSVTITLGGGS